MIFKLRNRLFIVMVLIVAVVNIGGCDRGRGIVMDAVPPADTTMDAAATMDATMSDVAVAPVKLVWLVNYPLGGKDVYLDWIASVAPTLSAPEEVIRIASYDNYYGENPHRLVEFEFDSFVDAMTYFNMPEIAAVFEELPNRASEVSMHTFIGRSDYSKNENPSRRIKAVYLIDYPLAGKAAYLEWIASNATLVTTAEEIKRASSYDNYYGASPHRYVEFEFDSIQDAHNYQEREELHAISIEFPNRTSRVKLLIFELRSDYVAE